MPLFTYASFPNSRFKPRSPTVSANTYQVTISDFTLPLTLLSPANANRTYIIIKNFSLSFNMFYLYATTSLVNPSAIPTFGVPEQLIYNNFTNTLYQKQDTGVTTNWIIVLPELVGERLEPLQSGSLDALTDIYGFTDAAIPVVPAVIAGIDEGRG